MTETKMEPTDLPYPLSSLRDLNVDDFVSSFYVRTHYPFRAGIWPGYGDAAGVHAWTVYDKNGQRVFAGVMTQSAAFQVEERLNIRAAQQLMTDK